MIRRRGVARVHAAILILGPAAVMKFHSILFMFFGAIATGKNLCVMRDNFWISYLAYKTAL
jgi:hypothetical protein